jgi:hypothetical protein
VNRRLSQEEDAELRRLAALAAYGKLGAQAAEVYAELRARDQRRTVREPVDVVVPLPRPASEDIGAAYRSAAAR